MRVSLRQPSYLGVRKYVMPVSHIITQNTQKSLSRIKFNKVNDFYSKCVAMNNTDLGHFGSTVLICAKALAVYLALFFSSQFVEVKFT